MGFQKGKPKTGGRLPGQPNRVTLDIKDHARAVIEDPDYQAKLKARLIEGSSPQLEVLLHYYAYGKPKLEVALVDSGIIVHVHRDIPPPVVVEGPRRALEDHSMEEE